MSDPALGRRFTAQQTNSNPRRSAPDRHPEPPLGVLVTHGELGRELLRTAETILGPQAGMIVRSNADRSHRDLMHEVEAVLTEAVPAGGAAVLFVDLAGGSCGQACSLVARRHPEVLLACGVNLPMLLEFLYHRGRVSRAELKARLLRNGRGGVSCSGWDQEG